MNSPRCPAGLGKSGRVMWRRVVAGFELNAGELAALEEACRISDLIARVDEDLAGDLTSDGSVGQVRAHPLLKSRTDLSALLESYLRALALPVGDEDAGKWRSPAAAAAARARWRGGAA